MCLDNPRIQICIQQLKCLPSMDMDNSKSVVSLYVEDMYNLIFWNIWMNSFTLSLELDVLHHGPWPGIMYNVMQHPPVHHPLETHYDSVVLLMDEPLPCNPCSTVVTYLVNPPTSTLHYLVNYLCKWVSTRESEPASTSASSTGWPLLFSCGWTSNKLNFIWPIL